jgi:hypothetical protein
MKDRELSIEIAPGLLPERVVLELRARDRAGIDHRLQTLLTSLEARLLGHAILDAETNRDREWPISVAPANHRDARRCFDVRPRLPDGVAVSLQLDPGNDQSRPFEIPLSQTEAHQLGHAFLAAANPSRSILRDD